MLILQIIQVSFVLLVEFNEERLWKPTAFFLNKIIFQDYRFGKNLVRILQLTVLSLRVCINTP